MTKLWASIKLLVKSRTFENLVVISAIIFVYIVILITRDPVYAIDSLPPDTYPTNVVTMNGVLHMWVHISWVEGGILFSPNGLPVGVCLGEAITNLTTLNNGDLVGHTINNNLTYVFNVTSGEFIFSLTSEELAEITAMEGLLAREE